MFSCYILAFSGAARILRSYLLKNARRISAQPRGEDSYNIFYPLVSQDALSVLLVEVGLDEYEESLRARGVDSPQALLRLTEAEAADVCRAKAVHARKLCDLIAGRRVKSSVASLESGLGAFFSLSRQPTPAHLYASAVSTGLERVVAVRHAATLAAGATDTQVWAAARAMRSPLPARLAFEATVD